eukprot:scaffold10904_cov30-Attheya_sp.AAC.1
MSTCEVGSFCLLSRLALANRMSCGLQAFFWVGYVSPFREGVLLRMNDPGVVPGAVSHADAALDADSDVVLETPPDADAYADTYILAAPPAWDSFQVYHDNEMVDDALFDQDKFQEEKAQLERELENDPDLAHELDNMKMTIQNNTTPMMMTMKKQIIIMSMPISHQRRQKMKWRREAT